ncbi:MAG: NAD(P)-dependent oxidoreductase [Lachnospiraceae bacterium]|nr:NAD(P)-dependent oxidoreductase [Lachnospiraceae bacterium]
MKVFIVGKYNTFTDTLIRKLHKENDTVYVLTGEKYYGKKPHYVFEQYTFSYSSDSITEVLDSVQPDVILFTGAYDSNFQWFNIRNESMHYLSGLINIILSAESHKVRNFIYLSSHQVYNSHSESLIPADAKTTANDYVGIAIAQGEDLCRHFNETTDLDIHILRIDHMYKTPENLEEATDVCSRLCLEAAKKGMVTVNGNLTFSMVNVADAIFGIFDFIHAKEYSQFIYQLSTSEAITELQIAEIIRTVDSSITIQDETAGGKQQIILDKADFLNEFHLKIFHTYEKTIPQIYNHIRKNKKNFLTNAEKSKAGGNKFVNRLKALFQAMLPFIENCILFLPVFMINNRAVGSKYFEKLDFFLLYVLLFAGVYGTKQAIFSAVLSTAGYFFRQLYFRTGMEVLVDYNTYLWIAQLFIVAMAVGRLRDSTKSISYEKDEEITFLSSQLEDLVDINESNNRIKNIYQNRILDYDDSLVKIYGITSELDSLEAGAVLFYAADIIGRILGTDDVAIYQIANGDYCRLFSATSKQAKSLGKSVKYSAMTEMMTAINNKQVYINKTMNEDYPLMASAIYRSDKPIELIMLWGLPFENMTVYHCNLLTVLGYMIYNSVERADRYLDALATTRFIAGTRLLTKDAFEELHHTYQDAMNKGFTEYIILSASSRYAMTYKQWSQKLSSKLRFSDYLGIDKQNRICILLTNSNIKDAQFIVQRFAEMDIICTPV